MDGLELHNTCLYGRDSIKKGLCIICLKMLLLIEGQAKTEIPKWARQGLETFIGDIFRSKVF